MSDKQVPIGSGFGARTTAEEILAGHDLTGKTTIITGGHSGLGWKRRARSPVPERMSSLRQGIYLPRVRR